MRTFLLLTTLFALGCGRAVTDRDAGECATNDDCAPKVSLINSQCGGDVCQSGACVPDPVDAGASCLFGFVDDDASAPIEGTCNGESACCTDGECAP